MGSTTAEASSEPPGRVPKDTFAKDRLPFIIATVGEFIGLYFWLYYWDTGAFVAATVDEVTMIDPPSDM